MDNNINIWMDTEGIVAEVDGVKFRPRGPMQLLSVLYNLPVTLDDAKRASERYQPPTKPGRVFLVQSGQVVGHCNNWLWNCFVNFWSKRTLNATADKWMHPVAKAIQLDRAGGIM